MKASVEASLSSGIQVKRHATRRRRSMVQIMGAEQFGLLWQVMALQKERTVKERTVKERARVRKARRRLSPLLRALVPWLSQQARSNRLILMTTMLRPKRKPRLLLMILMILSKQAICCCCSCSDGFSSPLGLGEAPSE